MFVGCRPGVVGALWRLFVLVARIARDAWVDRDRGGVGLHCLCHERDERHRDTDHNCDKARREG